MNKKLSLFSVIFLICIANSFSQKMRTGIEYKYDIAKVVQDSSITYFGWDFRYLIFNDPKFTEPKDVTHKLIPGLKGIIDKERGAEFMQKKFKKSNFVYDPRTIQSLLKNVDENSFVDVYREPLSIDSIISIVKSYPVKGSGLGAVIIADEMRKHDITVTAFVTIFDLESKQILYVCKIKGKAGDKGSVGRFYGKGVIEIMSIYWDYYKKIYKN